MELKDSQIQALQEGFTLQSAHLDDESWYGFLWHDVHSHPATLSSLVQLNLMDISYASRKYTHYKIRDMQAVEDILKLVNAGLPVEMPEEDLVIPSDIFDVVVGHEPTKYILKMALAASDPVHVRLVGPPASGKTLFLDELRRLPNSRNALGGTSSRAGIVDFLLEVRPRFLIFDEIDKCNQNDLDVLLSLMETGRVTRLKHGQREDVVMKTWVFAGANSDNFQSQALISRFVNQHLKGYTPQDFINISRSVLIKREKVMPKIADEIIDALLGITVNPRDAVKVARLVNTGAEVKKVVEAIWMT